MSNDSVSKLMSCFDSKKAPGIIGKPVFENDLKYLEYAGIKNLGQFIGKKVNEADEAAGAIPGINFGSKLATGFMPTETRLRLFHFKKSWNDMEIQAQYKAGPRGYITKELMMSTPIFKNVVLPMCKAFNVTDFSDWIDQAQARFFFEEYEIPLILADQFDSLPMDAPSVRVPGALGKSEGTLESCSAIFTPKSLTQSSYLVESQNNVCHTEICTDLMDDSAPAIIDKIRREVLMGVARSYERAILDGVPTGTTHIDDDTEAGAANLFSKAFSGLRHRAFLAEAALGAGSIIHDNANDTLNKDTFAELLKKLKCQGADKTDLIYIMGCTGSNDLVTGAIPELFTAFNFGSIASNVTGEVPPVFGIKVIESEKVREDLEADGKADNPTVGTTTYMLLVQKSRYNNWIRQAVRVWAAPSLPSSDFMLMTAKARHSFAGVPMGAGNPERNVAMAINIKTV